MGTGFGAVTGNRNTEGCEIMSEGIGKLCFVIPYLYGGGAERVVAVLASELANEGHPIALVKYCKKENEYPLSERVETYCMVESEEEYKQLSYPERIRRVRKLLKDIRPAYVVPFLPQVARHVFLASMGMGIRAIQTIRISPWAKNQPFVLRLIRDGIIALSYRTFVQTEEQRSYFPPFIQKKIAVIPNPVSQEMLEAEWEMPEAMTNILAAGRLVRQKNFALAIDAAACLRERGYAVQLSIYGEGEERDALTQYIHDRGADSYCFLRGRSNAMKTVYREHHIYLLTSDLEGLPNTLMEAMAVGMPCVATDCKTGPSDLLGTDRGILIPTNDLEEAVRALETMISRPEAARQYAQRAKRYMKEHYSPERISRLFLEMVLGQR